MARFALFEGSYAARYNNAMHAAYHTAEYKVLDTRGTLEERVHVTAAKMLEYKNCVDELNERTKEATASVDTLETTAQEVFGCGGQGGSTVVGHRDSSV